MCLAQALVRAQVIRDVLEAMSYLQITVAFGALDFELKSLDPIFAKPRPRGRTYRHVSVLDAKEIYICSTEVLIHFRPYSVVKPACVWQFFECELLQ